MSIPKSKAALRHTDAHALLHDRFYFYPPCCRLKLKVLGDTILDADLFKSVAPDDCTFTLEDSGDGRLVSVILQKLQKTSANGHWKCVCIGEPEIDTSKFGPSIMSADPNDPGGLARMMQEGGLG